MAFLGKYGVARHIYIPIIKRAVVDYAVGADWTPAAGDVKISKDGGAAANVTNLPTAITMGNTAMWDFSITATEMQAAQVMVSVADTATKAVEDQFFIIETYGNASGLHEFDLDTAAASMTIAAVSGAVGSVTGAVGSVTGAVGSVTGNVGGNVVGSVGSVTGAVGSVTGAVGSVAAGGITASSIAADAIGASELAADAATEIATAVWAVAMSDIAAVPAITASTLSALNWVFALHRNKRTQTATTETIYKDDGTTSLSTSTKSDDGTTFTRGEYA